MIGGTALKETDIIAEQLALPGLTMGVRESNACPFCVGLGQLEATDIFCGAGGSSLGLEWVRCPHCGRSLIRVTQAINHWDLAVEAHNANFPHADHDVHDVEEIPASRFRRTDILWASPECFAEGTLVLTKRGQTPIEDVQVGDYVLTHKSRWRKVVDTGSRTARIGELSGQGNTPGLRVTGDHKLWGRPSWHNANLPAGQRRRQFGTPGWHEAATLPKLGPEKGDASCGPRGGRGEPAKWCGYWSTPTVVPQWTEGDEGGGEALEDLIPPPGLWPEKGLHANRLLAAWWVVGRWIGDGSLTFGKNAEVTISCGYHEAEELAERLGMGWSQQRKRTATNFYRWDPELRDWLHRHFGHGARYKSLPSELLAMEFVIREAVLEGYLSADGSTGRRTSGATVSKALAVSLRLLAESLGYSTSLHRYEACDTIEGRKVDAQPFYIVAWETESKRGRPQEAFVEDRLRWTPVREWRELNEEATVWNLTVEEDHSYVADGIIAKNCVNHTSCKGKRDDSPAAQRSRATFKDIVRFTAHHRYDAVIVENVVEARLWCEHEDCACGAEFDAWFEAMRGEGYDGRIVYWNSQFSLPTPQSRDRMYVVFWRNGLPKPELNFRPVSYCTSCEQVVRGVQTWKRASRGSARELIHEWGRYGSQYIYTCPNEGCGQQVHPAVVGARSIIDFTLPIERIGDKPARMCKTCGNKHPVACNTRRRIRVGSETIAARPPVLVQVGGHLFERDGYARVWSVDDPLRTVTATNTTALVTPAGSREANARDVGEPMHAVTGTERLAMVLRYGGQSAAAREADEPMGTITAHDREIGLVVQAGGPTGAGRNARALDEPHGTVMTENHSALVTNGNGKPAGDGRMLVQVTRGDKGGSPSTSRFRHLDEPHPTVAGHGEMGLVEFRGAYGDVRELDEPAHTVTASGYHHGLLVYNGVPGFVRELDDAIGTITSRDKQALLVPFFRTGVARGLGEPAGTVTTHDREALVLTDADIDDCYLRMLQWQELLRAQMMHKLPDGSDYLLSARRRDSRGRMRELANEHRVRMIGNAVSGPVATMLGQAVVGILR